MISVRVSSRGRILLRKLAKYGRSLISADLL